MKKMLLSIVLVLLLCTQSMAESSVWKVQKGGSVMYLGGTFHILRSTDFPLPAEFKTAYMAADTLVFETDISRLQEPAIQQKVMMNAMYTDGSTIDKHLSPRTYNSLQKYCAASGIPLAQLKSFKPSIIALTLASVEIIKLGFTPEGVDTYFHRLAVQDQKKITWLESIDEQIQFIVGMGEDNADDFINHTLKEQENLSEILETMLNAWKNGDVRKLNNLFITDLKTTMPTLYKEMLTDRNENWLPLIEAHSKTPQTEFVLVGAGHLVGPDGIVKVLRQKGYTVEKL